MLSLGLHNSACDLNTGTSGGTNGQEQARVSHALGKALPAICVTQHADNS